MEKYKLVDFQQGETRCQHCGTGIKNIYTIEEIATGTQLNVGSECVKTLLEVEALPKEYKQIEKEYKNKKFNESIVNMLISFKPSLENDSIVKGLKNGTVKATDKSFIHTFIINKKYNIVAANYYKTEVTKVNGINYKNEVRKTDAEYINEIKENKEDNTKFLNSLADTKECKKFIAELVKYAEENFPVWGWSVKFQLGIF